MELSAEQISFMRGEIPASGPQVWMDLLEANLIRVGPSPDEELATVSGYRALSGGHLFYLTPEGAEAIRSRMVSAEITGITSSKE